jgi:hypothetical protein
MAPLDAPSRPRCPLGVSTRTLSALRDDALGRAEAARIASHVEIPRHRQLGNTPDAPPSTCAYAAGPHGDAGARDAVALADLDRYAQSARPAPAHLAARRPPEWSSPAGVASARRRR